MCPEVSLPFAPDFLNTAPRQHIFAVSGKSNFLSVIGSEGFVQRVSDQLFGEGKKRRFAEGQLSEGESLYMLRRLRE